MKNKDLIFSLLLALIILYPFCNLVHAQQQQVPVKTTASGKKSVSGKIVDDHKLPARYINVSLIKLSDSSVVKSTYSDTLGVYSFSFVAAGQYLVKASSMGQKNSYSKKFTLDSTQSNIQLEQLELAAESINLAGVTVTSRKPLIDQKIDRTVMNIENSIIASGNSVLDVLERAPGVSLDRQNDLIRLKNKSGVLVMIDGKRSYLSGTDLNNYLRALRSEQVNSIEIITNPSAKYDAAGNAGIINIKLKKNTALGTNGSVSASGGSALIKSAPDDTYNGSLNFNLNHKIEKWNFFANASTFRNADFNKLYLLRKVNYEGLNSTLDQNIYQPRKTSGITGKFGADYLASEKTTIGVMIDAGKWDGKLGGDSYTFINEVSNGISTASSVNQQSDAKTPRNNFTANINAKHEFDKKGAQLTFDADYSGFKNKRDQNFDTNFFNGNGNLASNLLQKNNSLSNIDIYAAKLDFVLPVSETLKFEAGLKSGYVNTKNKFDYEEFKDGLWENDPTKSNEFNYKESINAAYLNLGKQWTNWSAQAGLRAEYTQSSGNSVTTNQTSDKDYLSLFPTFYLSQTLNKNNAIRYSYGRRVDRPNYQQLNPFTFFLDAFTIEEGNPNLKPQFTDNFEISYSYKSAIFFSLSYSNTKDYLLTVTEQDDATKIVRVGQGNIGNYKNYAANLSFPLQPTKWWSLQNQVSTYYNKFSDPDVAGQQFNASRVAFNFNTSSTFTLSKTWTAEINMWFNSPGVYGVDRSTRSQYAVNAGIQKSFLSNQAKLKLSANDIFYTSYYTGALQYANVDFTVNNKWGSRRANLSFSYNFGNKNLKSSGNRGTANEDLKNRAGVKN